MVLDSLLVENLSQDGVAAGFVVVEDTTVHDFFDCGRWQLVKLLPVRAGVQVLIAHCLERVFLDVTPFLFQKELFNEARVMLFEALHFLNVGLGHGLRGFELKQLAF
jgi:hypothetical protein